MDHQSKLSAHPKPYCLVYETFGDCQYAKACNHSHDVSPYQTEKDVGNVVLKTNEIPGVIEFFPKAGKETSKKCYIAQGPWFSAGADSGDLVELIISRKVFQDTDFHYARVSKILERSSISQNQRFVGAWSTRQTRRPPCNEYTTFRNCESGTRCTYRHDVDPTYKQSFYIAKVHSVVSSGALYCEVEVELKDETTLINCRKTYHLPDQHKIVTTGNLVIVQESSRIYQRRRSFVIRYGRIAAILHNTQELEESDIPLERNLKLGFTMRIPFVCGTFISQPRVVSAYSTENCFDHDMCTRIGIHIRAATLGIHFKLLNKFFVPFFRVKARKKLTGFDVDSIRLALSIYAHSASKDVEGPTLTPLFIRRGSFFTITSDGDDKKLKECLEKMWNVFVKDSLFDDVVNSLASNDIATHPETWRERIVLRQMTVFFNAEIVKFLRSKSEKFVIARKLSSKLGIAAAEDIVIPAENLRMVETTWQSPHPTAARLNSLGFFLGSVKRTEKEYWEKILSGRYLWEVLPCDQLHDSHSVIVTYPIAEVVNYLNQQTVLSAMISPHLPLYTRNDILGILVRRYHTPVVLTSVVRRLSKTILELQLCGIFGRRRGSIVCTLKGVFNGSILSFSGSSESKQDSAESCAEALKVGNDDDHQLVEKMALILDGLTCEEYCNSKLVRLPGEKVAKLAQTSIEHGVEAFKTADEIRELLAAKIEYDSPYEPHARGTMVSLTCGVELQLQMSMEEDDIEFDHSLRLLRVGKDCHLCLVHLNSVDRAFLCGRRDARELMPDKHIDEIRNKIDSNSLKTITLKNCTVKWNDVYFSGGTFTTTIAIKPQTLLCIRKEIIRPDEKESFVWTCHAVVSEVCETEVRFLACSLFQDQTADMWKRDDDIDFIVEILDTEDTGSSGST